MPCQENEDTSVPQLSVTPAVSASVCCSRDTLVVLPHRGQLGTGRMWLILSANTPLTTASFLHLLSLFSPVLLEENSLTTTTTTTTTTSTTTDMCLFHETASSRGRSGSVHLRPAFLVTYFLSCTSKLSLSALQQYSETSPLGVPCTLLGGPCTAAGGYTEDL